MTPPVPAREATLVAVDFESTGSIAGFPDQPWQIGMIPVVRGEPDFDRAREAWLHVPLDRPFNPLVPGTWRLVRPELAAAPGLPERVGEWGPFLLGVPLIAHNAATERRFLRAAWPLHRPGPWIDTLKLARMAYPDLPRHDLESVSEAAGITELLKQKYPGRSPHDALYDAAASALVLCRLLQTPAWSALTVEDLVKAGQRRKPTFSL